MPELNVERPSFDLRVCDHVGSDSKSPKRHLELEREEVYGWPYFPAVAPLDSCYHHALVVALLR